MREKKSPPRVDIENADGEIRARIRKLAKQLAWSWPDKIRMIARELRIVARETQGK